MTLSPYPEFILPGDPFKIVDTGKSNASINKVDRVLRLPQGDPELLVMVSRHEMAHAKWSPDVHDKQNDKLFQACEDARINLGLQNLGIPFDYPPHLVEYYTGKSKEFGANPRAALTAAVALLGTNLEGVITAPPELQYAVDTVKELMLSSAKYAGTPESTIEDTEAAYEYILEQFDKAKEEAKEKATGPIKRMAAKGFGVTSRGNVVKKRKGKSTAPAPTTDSPAPTPEKSPTEELIEELEKDIEAAYEKPIVDLLAPPPEKPKPKKRFDEKDPLSCSAELDIRESKLTEKGCTYRRNTYTAEGSVLTAPHRMPIDGAIFRRRKRHFLEGTVLIDTSASMHLTTDQIREIILASSGHTTVAIYSGPGGQYGYLEIVASKGKMVKKVSRLGGLNTVDYPVLQWLGKQQGKKFWVCDGRVTGRDDYYYESIVDGCKELVKKHNIKQFRNMPEFMDFAKGLR